MKSIKEHDMNYHMGVTDQDKIIRRLHEFDEWFHRQAHLPRTNDEIQHSLTPIVSQFFNESSILHPLDTMRIVSDFCGTVRTRLVYRDSVNHTVSSSGSRGAYTYRALTVLIKMMALYTFIYIPAIAVCFFLDTDSGVARNLKSHLYDFILEDIKTANTLFSCDIIKKYETVQSTILHILNTELLTELTKSFNNNNNNNALVIALLEETIMKYKGENK